ncbi:MAG: hypothetical protein V9H26_13830 [Verrucomicrobiota bacterium]
MKPDRLKTAPGGHRVYVTRHCKMAAWQQLLNGKFRPVLGRHGQSEWELARGLLRQLPKAALLLADRLHGCGAFAAEALAAGARVGSHFLFRARSNVKSQGVRRCKDGSRLVRQKGPRHLQLL